MREHPIHGKPGPLCRAILSNHPINITLHRAALDGGSALFGVPRGTLVTSTVRSGVPCKRITGHQDSAGRMILYLHGGGYMVGSQRTHKSLAAHLACIARADSIVPHYRRSPEHPFPAALEDAYKAYLSLLDEGIDPSRIALSGDSAGGGLTVALLLALKAMGQPLPSCAYLMSPWVDLSCSDLRFSVPLYKRTDVADWFSDFMAEMYVGSSDPAHPFISPVFGDLSGLPPLFVAVGKNEPLRRQSDLLVEKARQSGLDVTYKPYRSPVHVLQALAPFSGRIRNLLGKGGDFIRERCPAG
ncbi:MAG: alpha/beta hydrolase [Desulfatibacillum sp.]|nr:alpha/beta hydrolase [Desulfatibacillum sp.]